MANQTMKPGSVAKDDVTLNVKAKDKKVGEIKVPAGSKVPPTRTSGDSYTKK